MRVRALRRKVRVAIALVREKGVLALLHRLYAVARARPTPTETSLVYELLRGRRGVLVDVGAHEGGSLSSFADDGWTVLAFEPDPHNRKKLHERFGAAANVAIDPRAVADHAATGVSFYRSEQSTGISTLSPFHDSHRASGVVDVTTLSLACRDRQLTSIDVLKIDTEGYDLAVLRGVPWEQVTPRVILCEFEDHKTVPLGYTFHDLARFLQDRGYRVVVSEWYPVVRYGGAHAWRRFAVYPCELADPRGWGNLIATRDQTDHLALLALTERHRPR